MSKDRFELFKEYCLGTEDCGTPEKFINAFEEYEKEEKKNKAKKERLEVIEKLCIQLKQKACFYSNIEIDVDHIWEYKQVEEFMTYLPAARLIGDKITIKFTGD